MSDSMEVFFRMSEEEIHNMNKNCYSNLNTYTEDRNAFILPEDIKDSKANKSSETKSQKTIVLERLTPGIIKTKSLSRRKKSSE